jgi:hypothetical protein
VGSGNRFATDSDAFLVFCGRWDQRQKMMMTARRWTSAFRSQSEYGGSWQPLSVVSIRLELSVSSWV